MVGVLSGVSFSSLQARYRLVGENGQEKPHRQLLTRLLHPTAGQILLDGRDLRIMTWTIMERNRSHFQDFMRYDLKPRKTSYGPH